ncbi:7831_t:CDS:2, partial [Gigaspora margarita]
VNKQARYPEGEEKAQGIRKERILKNKEEITGKEKAKENYYIQLESRKTEGSIVSAKSIEAIIISLMSTPIVLTNNSALGKGLAPHSTDLNRCQNYKRLVVQGNMNTFSTLKFGVYNINCIKNNVQKLQKVCDYDKTQKLNIIGLVKMNIIVKKQNSLR